MTKILSSGELVNLSLLQSLQGQLKPKFNRWEVYRRKSMELLQKNVTFTADSELEKVNMFLWDKKIWEMYSWVYHIWNEKFDHIWIEIDEEYRWKWLWKLLFNKFEETFWVLDIEYVRDKSIASFLIKMWYEVDSIINEYTWEEESMDWDEYWIELFSEWYSLKLKYTKK